MRRVGGETELTGRSENETERVDLVRRESAEKTDEAPGSLLELGKGPGAETGTKI